jgi:ribonuclease VapC
VKAEPKFVLDASALLAYLQHEPGFEKVQKALAGGAVMSTVNVAEVYAKVVARGLPVREIAANLAALGLGMVSFTESDAQGSAALHPRTRQLRLSLGDRACIAVGIQLGLPVLSADRAWKGIPGVKVEMLR